MAKNKVSPGKKAMFNESKALEAHGKKLKLNPKKEDKKKEPKPGSKAEKGKETGEMWYTLPPKPKFGKKKPPTKSNVPGAY